MFGFSRSKAVASAIAVVASAESTAITVADDAVQEINRVVSDLRGVAEKHLAAASVQRNYVTSASALAAELEAEAAKATAMVEKLLAGFPAPVVVAPVVEALPVPAPAEVAPVDATSPMQAQLEAAQAAVAIAQAAIANQANTAIAA